MSFSRSSRPIIYTLVSYYGDCRMGAGCYMVDKENGILPKQRTLRSKVARKPAAGDANGKM
jgi:hypothetical protein